MMHASVILVVLALNSQQSALQARDAKAIGAAKNTNVHQIEPSLPNKQFEQWLRDVAGPQAETKWEVNDCGEQTGNPALDKGRDFPMCAEAQVILEGKRKLHVLLPVGTFKTGVGTGPRGLLLRGYRCIRWLADLDQEPISIARGNQSRQVTVCQRRPPAGAKRGPAAWRAWRPTPQRTRPIATASVP